MHRRHYDDLAADLEGQMRRLAALLHIPVAEDRWPALVSAAGFPAMRERADQLVPDPAGVLRDRGAFFRRGSSGAARDVLTGPQLDRYRARAAQLAPSGLLDWLHRA